MKKILIQVLKVAIPISFGVFLMWWFWDKLPAEQKTATIHAIKNANYWLIGLSPLAGLLSHYMRAIRWRYLLEPLGHKPSLKNSFFCVMIGYGVNLLLPRVGEATRCGFLYRYEKIPFNQSLGTVLAERAVDFVILISITGITLISQFDILDQLMSKEDGVYDKLAELSPVTMGLVAAGLIACGIIGFVLLKKFKFGQKIKGFLGGILQGFKSVLSMPKKWAFIGHTIGIWVLYIFMFGICFYSLPGTSNISTGGIFAAFVMGSFGIVFVQGGIGVYPVLIASTLESYNIDVPDGFGLGSIIWAFQTGMVILVSVISLLLIQRLNKKEA